MIRRQLTLLFASFALGSALLAQTSARVPTPDPDAQREIRAVMHAQANADRDAALGQLEARRQAAPRVLAEQLFLYSASASSTRDGMAFGVLRPRLGLEDETLVAALVGFLESTDEPLRAEAARFLAEFEGAEADRPPTFVHYRPFLEAPIRRGAEPPPGLTRHVYETDPGRALLLLARIAERRQDELRRVLWAEHVTADAIWRHAHGFAEAGDAEPAVTRELALLGASEAWWARAYVARVARAHPELGQSARADALTSDAHPLVRRLAQPVR